MVNFLHLSDIHIPDKRGDLCGNIDPFKKLDALIEYTKKLELNPAFTIITGDLSQTGTTQSYKHVKKYISKLQNLGGPVLPIMGNCDKRSNFSKILLGKPSPKKDPPCYYSKTIEGIHVIAMRAQAGSSLELNIHTETGKVVTYDSSSFNVLGYVKNDPNRLAVRPIYFSEGQQLVDKTIEN